MLIFGIDKFMSECRAVVNFIGNAVATLFVGRWDRAVDSDRVRRVLDNEPVPALPAELDATTNPLAVESTQLDDEYHPHLHHEHHAPEPPTPSTTRSAGWARMRTPTGPMVGDASSRHRCSPHRGPAASADGDAGPGSPRTRPHTTDRKNAMNVLIAPDKFKGSLTAAEVVHHLGSGLRAARHPLRRAAAGRRRRRQRRRRGRSRLPIRRVDVAAATGERHRAAIAFDGAPPSSRSPTPAGCTPCPRGTPAPLAASSAGLGDAVRDALRLEAKRIVLALGGSASTDGGAGMLAVLGAVFRDEAGQPVTPDGGSLSQIHTVDLAGVPDLTDTEIVIASDVQNPLTGPDGAAAVYGPQKGADPRQVVALDAGLTHLVDRLVACGYPTRTKLAAHRGSGRRRWARVRRPAAGRARGVRRRLLPRPAAVRGPPRRLRPRHHRRRTNRRPDPARQTARDRRAARGPIPGHRGRRPQRPQRHRPARAWVSPRCTPSPTTPTATPR